MKPQPPTFLEDHGGASAPEYALVLAGMAAAVVIGLAIFGSSIGNALLASSRYIDNLALNFGPSQTASSDTPASPAPNPTPSPSSPTPTSSARGHAGGPHGQSTDAPGQGGDSPGKSESASGKNK